MHTPKRIHSTWHVLRAWKNHLKTIKDLDTEEKLYQTLKVLMDETDEHKWLKWQLWKRMKRYLPKNSENTLKLITNADVSNGQIVLECRLE